MFLTAQLVFTIFMLAAEKHKGTFIAPVGIGLSLFVAELSGVYYTGGSLNPARTFGPCVILRSFYHYHWSTKLYWVGPILGALLASAFYKFIKILEYETANPGQDFDDREQEFFDPTKSTDRPIVNLTSDGSAIVEEGSSRPDSGLPDISSPGPAFEQPPPVESRTRSKGGKAGALVEQHDDIADDEASGSGSRYQKGPDAESGKVAPRDSGMV
ncbi:MAG: hypothetical protein Q9209_006909 [Squamulea sp. 1 TL-2023]